MSELSFAERWRIEKTLLDADRVRTERRIQLLAEILTLVPNPETALEVLADSTIENLDALLRKLRELHQRKA